MICFNCGCNLPDDEQRLCRLCGMKMPADCSACGSSNPEFAGFCLACGASLSSAPAARQPGAEVLLESRRNVAVIFADVSGFTALSEKLDPEEVRRLINDCFQTITRPVYELEGTIDKYIGDCVMILFGARYAHADDPVRAVDCAVSMLRLIREFSEERLAARGLSLTLSIGVNYGLVVTGSVGNYYDKDYTVMGDVVNTAQRLQTAAASGTVLVSESIREEARDAWDFADIGTIAVKNRKEPVHCFAPTVRRHRQTREQPLLERSAHLRRLLELAGEAGGCASAMLVGDPGTGKSALAKALADSVEDAFKVIRTECGTTYRHRAHHAVSMILHGIMNLSTDESSQAKRVRLASYSYWLFGDGEHDRVGKTVDFLGILMGIDKTREFRDILAAMRHEDVERELTERTAEFIAAATARQPHLFIADDFQWADDSSVARIADVLGRLGGARAFFLFLTRRRKPEWTGLNAHAHEVAVEPLSGDASARLAASLLGVERISEDFARLMLRTTHGNPMLIVEWTAAMRRRERILISDGTAGIDLDDVGGMPASFDSLVLSSLSELPDDTVEFLRMAAVIGSEFKLSWVTALSASSAEPERMLTECVEAGLLATRAVSVRADRLDRTIGFRHDSTREAIVGSLLHAKRTEIHRRFADWLERSGQAEAEGVLELLHEHLDAAGQRERADACLYRLAVRQRENYSLDAADATLAHLVSRTASEPNAPLRLRAMIDRGALGIQTSRFDEALAVLTDALALDPPADVRHQANLMLAEIHMEKAQFEDALSHLDEMESRVRSDPQLSGSLMRLKCVILRQLGSPKALVYARQAAAALRKAQDHANLSEVLSQTAYIHFARGAAAIALKELNQSYELAERTHNLGAVGRLSGNLGIIHHASGSVSKAVPFLERAIELAVKVSNPHGQASSRINLGILHLEKGAFAEAEAHLQTARSLAARHGLTYHECLACLNIGDLALERGVLDEADEAWRTALLLSEAHGLRCEETLARLGLAKVEMRRCAADAEENGVSSQEIGVSSHGMGLPSQKTVAASAEAVCEIGMLEALDRLREVCGELDDASILTEVEQARTFCLFLLGRLEDSLEACESALNAAEAAENRFVQVRVIRLSAILARASGRTSEAEQTLLQALAAAHSLDSSYEAAKCEFWLGRYDAALADMKGIGSCRWRSILEETAGGSGNGQPPELRIAWLI